MAEMTTNIDTLAAEMRQKAEAVYAANKDDWELRSALRAYNTKTNPVNILALLDDRDRLKAENERTCNLAMEDDDFGAWSGKCGAVWCFNDGGPKENNMKFCPECGGRVVFDTAIEGEKK